MVAALTRLIYSLRQSAFVFALYFLDAEVRPDAILLFGVNEMSTKDVFDYFQDYMPGSIEWVDDISCMSSYMMFSSGRKFNSHLLYLLHRYCCLGG